MALQHPDGDVLEETTTTIKCQYHGKQKVKEIVFVTGKTITGKCPECTKKKRADRAYQDQAADEAKKRERMRLANFPPRFRDKTFENYNPSTPESKKALEICSRYAIEFREKREAGASLLLCGKPGTGKTHLGYAILRTVLAVHGYEATYTTVYDMLKAVKETWGRDVTTSESKVKTQYTKPDLLILDEVGIQHGTDAEKLILFEIIDRRYQSMKPTVVIGNLSIAELTGFLGERVIDRLREGGGAAVIFDWDSYRRVSQ